MYILKNNIEIWGLEKDHLNHLKEVEQMKVITKALLAKGIDKADVAVFYEGVDVEAMV